jgi:5-(carboxyamino)imidazole ribonucleotide synthase
MSAISKVLPHTFTPGILGDGQLGRMLAFAAANLGYKVAIIGPMGPGSPAGLVSEYAYCWGDISNEESADMASIEKFAHVSDVIILEWENVPIWMIEKFVAMGKVVCPAANVLEVAQDRIKEKKLARQLKIPTVAFGAVMDSGMLKKPITSTILKTCRGGYDGKGQVRVELGDSLEEAWKQIQGKSTETIPCILESVAGIDYETSVIVGRDAEGEMVCFPLTKNDHEDCILRNTVYEKGAIPEIVEAKASLYACTLAEHLGVVGLLAVEFFVTKKGEVLFNEMAPRPHNSGHWTIEGCDISQFEMYIFIACGLPMCMPEPSFNRVTMKNYIGELPNMSEELDEGKSVHLYGKEEVRKGRKMGHVTLCSCK